MSTGFEHLSKCWWSLLAQPCTLLYEQLAGCRRVTHGMVLAKTEYYVLAWPVATVCMRPKMLMLDDKPDATYNLVFMDRPERFRTISIQTLDPATAYSLNHGFFQCAFTADGCEETVQRMAARHGFLGMSVAWLIELWRHSEIAGRRPKR